MKKIILLSVFLLSISISYSQEDTLKIDTLRQDALKVYMDAGEYTRREITFVNYVRDIKEAQLYIISTHRSTGSGGAEYTYYLTGQHEFQGMKDTLYYTSSVNETYEEQRLGSINVLRLGLARYVLKTPYADRISLQYTEPETEKLVEDKWNSWIFRASLNGYLNGQKTYKSLSTFGYFEANKITPDWKLNFDIAYDKNEGEFKIEDEIIKSVNNGKSLNAHIVKSLGIHWATGVNTTISSSTYTNNKLEYSLFQAIEFNIFPYSESARKQITFMYGVGYIYSHYEDSTIYNKIKENLFGNKLRVVAEIVQKWGEIYIRIGWQNYFHDWKKNNLSISGSLRFRMAKGLRFNFGGGGSLIRDQLSLVKGGQTLEEILLRQKEIETNYRYHLNFGFSYTFGSIYNNVVNPRLRSGMYF